MKYTIWCVHRGQNGLVISMFASQLRGWGFDSCLWFMYCRLTDISKWSIVFECVSEIVHGLVFQVLWDRLEAPQWRISATLAWIDGWNFLNSWPIAEVIKSQSLGKSHLRAELVKQPFNSMKRDNISTTRSSQHPPKTLTAPSPTFSGIDLSLPCVG